MAGSKLPSWPKTKDRKIFLWLLISANLIAAAIGFVFWYGEQLLSIPWYLWIVTPDCPIAAVLFVASLLLIRKGINLSWLYFITAVWLLKYGFWTVVAYTHMIATAGTAIPMLNLAVMVLVLLVHIVMMIEGYWLSPYACRMRKAWIMIPLAIMLFFINDYFDYYSGTLVTLPRDANLALYAAAAMFGTILFPFIVYWCRHKAVKFIYTIYD